MKKNPGFTLKASTLDAYADVLWPLREQFPVVTEEIGDTWIHGIGSAPKRISRYLAARRTYDRFSAEGITPKRRAFGRKLLEVPEHTWGVDTKTYLRDETAWDRPAFEVARRTDPRFAITERSWAEQDAIVDEALALLPEADRKLADDPAQSLLVEGDLASIEATRSYPLEPFTLTFDPVTGALLSLSRDSQLLLEAGPRGMFAFEYESYDAADMTAYITST